MSLRNRSFCFVLFGCELDYSLDDLKEFLVENCDYFVCQVEECPTTKRPHVQGYIYLSNKYGLTMSGVKRRIPWLKPAGLKIACGTPAENRRYCTKEESRIAGPWEFGDLPQLQGGRPKEKVTLDDAIELMKELGGPAHLCRAHAGIYGRFSRQLNDVWVHIAPKEVFDDFQPRPWQQQILDVVDGPVDNRSVHWVVDQTGGKGKTYLARYLVSTKNAFYCTGGKSADVLFAFGQDPKPVVIFDYTRETQDFVNYSVVETLKNGIIFSGKYVSKTVSFPTPHVICFSNFDPDMTKLSRDRWCIKKLEEEQLPPVPVPVFL